MLRNLLFIAGLTLASSATLATDADRENVAQKSSGEVASKGAPAPQGLVQKTENLAKAILDARSEEQTETDAKMPAPEFDRPLLLVQAPPY